MNIGVSAFAWTGKFGPSHLDLLPALKEMGFDGFEIPMFDPSELDAAAIRRAFEANNLDCTVCAILPKEINPISPAPDVRKKSVEHLAMCIQTAAALGAKLIGGPLYAPIGYLPGHRQTKDEWLWAVEYFQAVGDLLDEHALTLSIEPVNRSETFFLRTAAEAKQFCDTVGHPRIGVTIDTFHANIEERNVCSAILSLGSTLKHIHLSENDRGLLGYGHVPFPEILNTLQKIGYDGYLVIEGFGYSPAENNSPGALWADREASPEDIAYKGFQYLAQRLR